MGRLIGPPVGVTRPLPGWFGPAPGGFVGGSSGWSLTGSSPVGRAQVGRIYRTPSLDASSLIMSTQRAE